MKVLQVNAVSGYGSTGRICVELSEGLIAMGHEAYIAFSHGVSSIPGSFRFGNPVEQKIHAMLSRITGLQGYFSYFGTRELINWINEHKPDVVHLHNLHSNNINLIRLLNFLAEGKIPTAITLHDCWYFTGKCTHYTDENCRKWESHCFKCPRIRKDNKSYFFDRTPKMFKEKKRAFGRIEMLAVIGVSDWITNEARKSYLKDAKILERVYNWIDQSVFKPSDRNVRIKYRIPEGKSIVLGVSAGWDKRDSKLNDFIKLSEFLPDNAMIILVGHLKNKNSIPQGIHHIPFVKSGHELAEIYSMADVYVHLSTEDTFGKVIAEAMACGTPVVVYNSTACSEVVGEGCGYAIDKRDLKGVSEAVIKIMADGKLKYSEKCIQHIKGNFNFNLQVKKTIHVYNKILQL